MSADKILTHSQKQKNTILLLRSSFLSLFMVQWSYNPHNFQLIFAMSPPLFTSQQEHTLFQAVGRRLAAIVTNTRSQTIAEQVPDIAETPVLGAFVSLKRYGELRSCMGTMSDVMPLGKAVESATSHAAKDDPRFPPVAASELHELDLEVWILWGMKRVAARGEERLSQVEIGRHGVQIAMGGNRGLLLPGVAVEYQMDAQEFLEAVCQKAGLPKNVWRDDRSLLHTFEGRAIHGSFNDVDISETRAAKELKFARFERVNTSSVGPTYQEVVQLKDACVQTLRRFLTGQTTSPYFPGLFDGQISGLSLSFQMPDRPPFLCSKIAVKPEMTLQLTMIELAKVLATQIERFGVTQNEIINAEMDMLVLWDPVIHGNATRYDFSAFEMSSRSLMLSAPEGWLVLHDATQTAQNVLNECVNALSLKDFDLGEVISFESQSLGERFMVTSNYRPDKGPDVRPAAIAGTFYPGTAREIQIALDRLIPAPSKPQVTCQAVMVPHAGWMYSGPLAAETLASIRIPDRAMIFAPKHRAGGTDWAMAPNKVWELPGGAVESDDALADAVVEAVDFFQFDTESHEKEHAIEVMLPILSRLSPKTKIVAGVLGMSSWPMIASGAEQFAKFLQRQFLEKLQEIPLLVVSSDMNHFASEETTRKVDQLALDSIKTLQPKAILETVLENQISMCGVVPLVFVLETLRLLGRLRQCEIVGYTTSAAASNDKSRVVGYAGIRFL